MDYDPEKATQQGLAQGAVTGAGLGGFAGPLGALFGAAFGAVAGGIIAPQKAKKDAELAEEQEEIMAQAERDSAARARAVADSQRKASGKTSAATPSSLDDEIVTMVGGTTAYDAWHSSTFGT